jgi:hypothetical protein
MVANHFVPSLSASSRPTGEGSTMAESRALASAATCSAWRLPISPAPITASFTRLTSYPPIAARDHSVFSSISRAMR